MRSIFAAYCKTPKFIPHAAKQLLKKRLPIGTAVNHAEMILGRTSVYPDIQEIIKKRLLTISFVLRAIVDVGYDILNLNYS
jgi:hypothetical protein